MDSLQVGYCKLVRILTFSGCWKEGSTLGKLTVFNQAPDIVVMEVIVWFPGLFIIEKRLISQAG
jgi:hypothetical protein